MEAKPMVPDRHVVSMPSYEKRSAAKFPLLEKERHAAPAPKHKSRLDLMRSQYHDQLLRDKEIQMVNILTQQQQNALNKVRSHSYQHPHSAKPEPDHNSMAGRQGFLSAGYSSRYNNPDIISHTQTSNWPAKKKSGVDRGYPLKPVVHRKGVRFNNIVAAENPSEQPLRSLNPIVYHNSKIRDQCPSMMRQTEVGPAFSPGLLELQKQSRSKQGRDDPWQKLEAVGENLEAEIRKKEALLREKLRRTEEELRRIQREKEQAEQEEIKERECQERRRRPNLCMNPKTAPLKPTNAFKNQVMVQDSSDNDEYQDHHTTRYNTNSRGERSWMNSTVPSSYRPSPHEYEVERLKKERLVASNNKIRNREPPPSNREPLTFFDHTKSSSRQRVHHLGRGLHGSASSIESDSKSDYRHYTSSAKLSNTPMSEATPPTLSDEEDERCFETEVNSELVPCDFCKRYFLAERLEKHKAACWKMQNSKRKVFDSSKARAKGTDLEPYLYRKSKTTTAQEKPNEAKKNMWRQKHESFIRNIRQARVVQQVIAKGGKLSDLPPPPPDENPDYIPCEHCGRRFAPKAAARHIPKCKDIKSKPRPPPQKRF